MTRVAAFVVLLAMASALPCAAGVLVAYSDDDIKVYDVEARRHTTLTKHRASDHAPSWSGDGHQIAFWSDRNGPRDIYTMDADGSSVTQRTHSARRERAPVFSWDARHIAFVVSPHPPEDRTRIAVLNLFTGTERFVTTGDGILDTWPSWFPDNERILFARRGNGVGLYQASIDGRVDEERIRVGWMPSMGMDGRSVAYIMRAEVGHDAVHIYDIVTGKDTLVPIELPEPFYLQIPRWAGPKQLLVKEGAGDLYLVEVATGKHEALPLTGWSARAFDPAHPWDASARGKKPFTWGWLKSLSKRP